MIYNAVDRLVRYGLDKELIPDCEAVYSRNLILEVIGETEYYPSDCSGSRDLPDILKELTDFATEKGLIENTGENRDIFDTKLMNCITPRPVQVMEQFFKLYNEGPKAATDHFYKFSQDTNYIRRDRIEKDRRWTIETEYGTLDITINLSKPEKDPKDIAAALKSTSAAYPKCQLCLENVGYSGRIGHPARMNHRVISLDLCGEKWSFQYSPYVYYNEHCIVFNNEHTPMKISRRSFERLFDFERQFPHYFIGSNADLPIVGGSILTHDHFQGGNYTFAMEKAPIEKEFKVKGFEDIKCGRVKWPLSVIRLRGSDCSRLTELASHILDRWREYTDESAMIFAVTDSQPHNTITPIARRRGDDFEIDLCLRNNLTTAEHPLGLYHPHAERHHIKKENIGLIEVMGLAVLPSRLNKELTLMEECILNGDSIESHDEIKKHAEWAAAFVPVLQGADRSVIRSTLEQEVGKVFAKVLEDAGVFKRTEEGFAAFDRFIETL